VEGDPLGGVEIEQAADHLSGLREALFVRRFLSKGSGGGIKSFTTFTFPTGPSVYLICIFIG